MTTEDIVIRLLLAIFIGGSIGYEREFKNRPAGFRTHILVCIGATVISLIQISMAEHVIQMITINPKLGDVLKVDYARLGAQVITGVGFLGAGTILHTKGSIKGLTTAASLWVVACLGLAIGMGYYLISICGTIAVAITLETLKRFQKRFITKSQTKKMEIQYVNKEEAFKYIDKLFAINAIKIKELEECSCDKVELEDKYAQDGANIYTLSVPKYIEANELIKQLSLNKNILKVRNVN
ncbi:MgtC/SapB family protein [Clostridium sp. ZS2-4]|uniref:MgtC/SapB family protein n=1 Tax=Clostridium sp. ZS2-4 TaxID=2987703 RepID=UPI002DD69272|nr:MgtC/SapB family protein [Clostridium sp. ZS2-4]